MKDLMRVIGMWQKSGTRQGDLSGKCHTRPHWGPGGTEASYREDVARYIKAATAGSRWAMGPGRGATPATPTL